MAIYDISRPLAPATQPWPGDTPFSLVWGMRMAEGASCNVSAITLSPHVGTHADAPYHYSDAGASMAAVALDAYIGPALLVDVPELACVTAPDLAERVPVGTRRVLLRTRGRTARDPYAFDEHFTYLDPGAIDLLAARGCILVGTDAPSVDHLTSQDLPAHKACLRHGILILENLELAHVPDGEFELIALPLKLAGADASPVRAVLRRPD